MADLSSTRVYGDLDVTGNINGNVVKLTGNQTIAGAKTFSSTITGGLNGNAATATKWATARTLAITGDLTYTSPGLDGTGNVSAVGTIANSAVTNAKIGNNAVTTEKIADGAVTPNKLAEFYYTKNESDTLLDLHSLKLVGNFKVFGDTLKILNTSTGNFHTLWVENIGGVPTLKISSNP